MAAKKLLISPFCLEAIRMNEFLNKIFVFNFLIFQKIIFTLEFHVLLKNSFNKDTIFSVLHWKSIINLCIHAKRWFITFIILISIF